MKIRLHSSRSYYEIKALSDAVYEGSRKNFVKDMWRVIEEYENRLRPSPHIACALNFSIATSVKNTFVIGVRYQKPDKTYTEDHYLVKKGRNMRAYSKNELERALPEYKGSHKWQPLGSDCS